MSDKTGFAERLARIEARQDRDQPDMLAGVAPELGQSDRPTPKRRWGAAVVYMCLGLGLVGTAVVLTLNKIEASSPGTKALIAQKLSQGESVNFLEIVTRANVGEDEWTQDTDPANLTRPQDAKLSSMGRFILNN